MGMADVQSSLSRLDAKGQDSIFLRPGPTDEQGWVWFLGLSVKQVERIQNALADPDRDKTFTSFRSAWSQLTRRNSAEPGARKKTRGGSSNPASFFTLLDKKVKPVQRVEKPDGGVGWIVLVGDAASGKPFYLGSTLNGHFHDTTALRAAPWTCWSHASREGASPFKQYVEQYRRRTDTVGFRAKSANKK